MCSVHPNWILQVISALISALRGEHGGEICLKNRSMTVSRQVRTRGSLAGGCSSASEWQRPSPGRRRSCQACALQRSRRRSPPGHVLNGPAARHSSSAEEHPAASLLAFATSTLKGIPSAGTTSSAVPLRRSSVRPAPTARQTGAARPVAVGRRARRRAASAELAN
jgi:hypothetical protein